MQLSYPILLVAAASSVLARRLVITPAKLFSGNDVYIYSNDGTEHAIKDFVPIDGCKYNRGSIRECCVDIPRKRAHFKYKGQSTKYCFKYHSKTGTGKDTRFIYGEAGCSCHDILELRNKMDLPPTGLSSVIRQGLHRQTQQMSNLGRTPEGRLLASFTPFSAMGKKDRVRYQLRLCANQMQQLLDQLNPAHNISQSLKNSIAQIQHFNNFDQPNVISLWKDLLHEPRAFPFRSEEFCSRGESQSLLDRRAERNLNIPTLVVDTNNNREGGLHSRKRRNDDEDELIRPDHGHEEGSIGVEKEFESHGIIDKMNDPATKWKVLRKRRNGDYDGDDELNQPQPKRTKLSKK
ncbi:unnamed protein product [Fusarium fujikuroi]|nr:hypothetical protein CEK25_003707 [Fusarium fujikuroi]VZH99162.1 unnamed protein product [Fusarium fujikuroi]